MSENDRKIEDILKSIQDGYDKLVIIEKDLTSVREKKEILYSQV